MTWLCLPPALAFAFFGVLAVAKAPTLPMVFAAVGAPGFPRRVCGSENA